ncbi:MAG TPA: histidine phosphatase family protein [Burkholderiaceae bacterium]|nr:histidine phosphatase family protein [Burkholderiaceae bacterium]
MSDEVTQVLAIRHGETDWNVELRVQGQLDIGLNETGRRQARHLAAAFAGEALHAVYSSDLARAHATALCVADAAGLAVQTHQGLRERGFGRFEGLTFDEIESRHPEDARRWRQRDPDFAPAGGEALRTFQARAVATIAAIAERHRGQRVAIVTHGGVLDALYRAAARIALDAPRTWQLGNAAINRVLHGAHGFTLVGWSDTQHLLGGMREEGSA